MNDAEERTDRKKKILLFLNIYLMESTIGYAISQISQKPHMQSCCAVVNMGGTRGNGTLNPGTSSPYMRSPWFLGESVNWEYGFSMNFY